MSDSSPCAVIDVGSNTVRLLVAVPHGGELSTLIDDSAFVRLGSGVDETGALNPERERAAVEAIERMAALARSLGANPVLSIATSAVRDASNRNGFIQEVRQRSDVEVEVISGEREAELTYRGATLGMEVEGPVIVCDLGGGSAELIHADESGMRWARSLPLGSGRLSERFVRHDPPHAAEQEDIRSYVTSELRRLPQARADTVVLTGGTAKHVAFLAGAEGTKVVLDRGALDRVQHLVCSLSAEAVVERYGVEPERARVLPAGITALQAIAAYYEASQVVITWQGIREGTIVDYLERAGRWPSHQR